MKIKSFIIFTLFMVFFKCESKPLPNNKLTEIYNDLLNILSEVRVFIKIIKSNKNSLNHTFNQIKLVFDKLFKIKWWIILDKLQSHLKTIEIFIKRTPSKYNHLNIHIDKKIKKILIIYNTNRTYRIFEPVFKFFDYKYDYLLYHNDLRTLKELLKILTPERMEDFDDIYKKSPHGYTKGTRVVSNAEEIYKYIHKIFDKPKQYPITIG